MIWKQMRKMMAEEGEQKPVEWSGLAGAEGYVLMAVSYRKQPF